MPPPKRRSKPGKVEHRGRVTTRRDESTLPSATEHSPFASKRRVADHKVPVASSRYTPPVPRSVKVSPRWVPILMFTLLGLGLVVIFCNYLGILPGGTGNKYLLVGLGFILAGIITATQYR